MTELNSVRSFIIYRFQSDKITESSWAGYAACMEEIKNAYKILVGKPEGRDYLGDQALRG
jgi:hypothetical protein